MRSSLIIAGAGLFFGAGFVWSSTDLPNGRGLVRTSSVAEAFKPQPTIDSTKFSGAKMRPKSFLSERDPEFVWDVKEESPDDLSYRFGYPSDMPTSEPADISRRAKREAVRVRRSAKSNVPHYKRKWAQEVFQAD